MWGRLSLVLAALLLAACGGDPGQGETPDAGGADEGGPLSTGPGTVMDRPAYDPGELSGTRWVLASLDGSSPVGGSKITLNFREEALRGNAGCNFYGSTEVRAERGLLEIAPGDMTMIGCKGPVGEQESAYLEALYAADAYRLGEDRLEILDKSGETTLLFRKETR